MQRSRIASAALSVLVLLPACSLIIDTNPDGVITGVGGGGKGKGGSSSGGTAAAGTPTSQGGAIPGATAGTGNGLGGGVVTFGRRGGECSL